MKTLFLLRHAKSDWSDPHLKDFERPLNDRGERVAPRMGVKLKELEIFPDKISCSTAVRAVETLKYVGEQLEIDFDDVYYSEDIYDASTRSLFNMICGLDDEVNSAMFVGHNPTFTYVAEYLTGSDIGNVPTCGVVKIDFDLNFWNEVSQGTGNLDWFIYPKKFDF